MEKIVGNIIILTLCIMQISYAGISLRVTDRVGLPLKEAVVGEVFNIEVVASGSMRDFQLEELNEGIVLTGQQAKSSQLINGSLTVKYAFVARANKLGSFTIGACACRSFGR